VSALKQPPHSTEAEQSVLGALLLDNQAFERVSWLTENAFYANRHRRLWVAIARLIESGRTADIVTTAEALGNDLEKAGGAAYLGALAQNTPSAFNVKHYAEVVRDKAILRRLAQQGTEIATRALTGFEDPRTLAEEAGSAFLGIEVDQRPAEMAEFGLAVTEAVEWADNPVKGLSSGYKGIDNIMQGLMPGDLIIVAGRPSMGKTALAMNIAEHVAKNDPVAVFSLEMTRRKIAARALKYHEALTDRDHAVDYLAALKLHIDDSAAITLGHMRTRLGRVKRKHGLALAVVDYLQLMTAKAENRTQEVSVLSRGLKAIAKDFGIPIIAVAQLSRGVEARTDHRPMLSDLRESGQIEQDADVIAFLYRDEYYKPDSEWRGIAEVIFRKNRDGATGTAYLTFVPEHTRFKPLDRPLPERSPAPKGKFANFTDFKSAAAGVDA
jgi:replicative DNA helicase